MSNAPAEKKRNINTRKRHVPPESTPSPIQSTVPSEPAIQSPSYLEFLASMGAYTVYLDLTLAALELKNKRLKLAVTGSMDSPDLDAKDELWKREGITLENLAVDCFNQNEEETPDSMPQILTNTVTPQTLFNSHSTSGVLPRLNLAAIYPPIGLMGPYSFLNPIPGFEISGDSPPLSYLDSLPTQSVWNNDFSAGVWASFPQQSPPATEEADSERNTPASSHQVPASEQEHDTLINQLLSDPSCKLHGKFSPSELKPILSVIGGRETLTLLSKIGDKVLEKFTKEEILQIARRKFSARTFKKILDPKLWDFFRGDSASIFLLARYERGNVRLKAISLYGEGLSSFGFSHAQISTLARQQASLKKFRLLTQKGDVLKALNLSLNEIYTLAAKNASIGIQNIELIVKNSTLILAKNIKPQQIMAALVGKGQGEEGGPSALKTLLTQNLPTQAQIADAQIVLQQKISQLRQHSEVSEEKHIEKSPQSKHYSNNTSSLTFFNKRSASNSAKTYKNDIQAVNKIDLTVEEPTSELNPLGPTLP